MYHSLREFIELLDQKGELIRVKEFTDPVLEITRRTDIECKKEDGGKALLFENTGTPYPVVTNMMGSSKRMLLALGIDTPDSESSGWRVLQDRMDTLLGKVLRERRGFSEKLKLLPTLAEAAAWLPKSYNGSIPPCQEVVIDNIEALPVLKCWEGDGGRFITLPMVHTQDPISGSRNVGMYRMQIFDSHTTGMHWHRHKTGARHYDTLKHLLQEWEDEEEKPSGRLPVAVTLGGDPVYTYCATAPIPDGIDEYLLAGFLRGKPVRLTECKTQPIRVPADCDFVIEGYVDVTQEKVIEGPFGDHTGFYSLADYYPQFHITCITHRSDAIYPATIVGVPPMEDKYIGLATEKIFFTPIKFVFAPEIVDFFLPEEGVQHNFAIVKIKKSYPGQGHKVANALWGAGQMMFNKFIIVVDDTPDTKIDIRDWDSLFDAIERNYLPSRDTLLTKGPLDILDHTSTVCGYGGKICIDATHKLPEELAFASTTALIPPSDKMGQDSEKGTIFSPTSNIKVILDSNESPDNRYRNLWLLGSHCDPVRDSSIGGDGTLILDATTKKGKEWFTREWPDEVR